MLFLVAAQEVIRSLPDSWRSAYPQRAVVRRGLPPACRLPEPSAHQAAPFADLLRLGLCLTSFRVLWGTSGPRGRGSYAGRGVPGSP